MSALGNFQTASKYWNKLKERLNKEGSQTVTNCHQLKMLAGDSKKLHLKNKKAAQTANVLIKAAFLYLSNANKTG